MKTIFPIFTAVFFLVAFSTVANAGSTAMPDPDTGGGGGKTMKSGTSSLNKSVSGKVNSGSTTLPNPATGGPGCKKIKPRSTSLPEPGAGGGGTRF
jgi:hypothetical protein